MQKILIVDDTPANIKILIDTLTNPDYELLIATSGTIALKIAASEALDLILLDIIMQEMDGYEVCAKLKANTATQQIPVIFITARDDEEDETKGLELGAVDYITKPINPVIVQARVKTHLKLKHAYEELENKNAALAEAAILRDNVDGILRHDLKSPINGIIGYTEVMAELELNPKLEKIRGKIETLGYETLNMINRSLDLHKMEIGIYHYQPDSTNVLRIFKKIMVETTGYAQARKLSVKLMLFGKSVTEDDTFIVQGEYLLCYSMFANLFKNALEAAPVETLITVSFSGDENKENAIISIHNKGVVPKEIRENFFDKYTTFGKSNGTGLGTYSAKLMAETQGGNISFETSEETGTTVTVRLLKG
jgi:CheY-like chemotaxis protein